MNTSAILLIQSSCKHGDVEKEGDIDASILYSSVHDDGNRLGPLGSFSTGSRRPNDTGQTSSRSHSLTDLPIICHILLMPEHQHSELHQVLHISSPPSPCGISNVVLLENLPWNIDVDPHYTKHHPTISTSILMSFTSCTVTYDLPPSGLDSQGMARRHLLPIDPIPSTFAVDYKGHTENSSSSNHIIGEVQVEFDFTEASRQAQELRMALSGVGGPSPYPAPAGRGNRDAQIPATKNMDNLEQDRTKSAANNSSFVTNTCLQHEPNICSDSRVCCFDHSFDGRGKANSLFQPSPAPEFANPSTFHDASANKAFHERKLLLEYVQSQTQQEARMLDRTLKRLACVGLFLIGILIWAIYQHYRFTAKSNAEVDEIRESMQKTRNLLKKAIEALRQPEAPNARLKKTELMNKIIFYDDCENNSEATIDSNPPLLYPATHFTTISQSKCVSSCSIDLNDDHAVDGSRSGGAAVSEIPQSTQRRPSPHQQRYPLNFHGSPSRRSRDHQRATSSSPSFRNISPARSLSPCSLFAKEWYERKTVRRNNRKKRGSFLLPISSPKPERGGTRRKHNDGERDSVSHESLSCFQTNKNDENKISGPPKLRSGKTTTGLLIYAPEIVECNRSTSSALCSPTQNFVTPSKPVELSAIRKESSPVVPPPVSSESYIALTGLPQLCSTPLSEDNSFVDDYW